MKTATVEQPLISRIGAVMMITALPVGLAANNLIRIGTFEHDKTEIMRAVRNGEYSSEYAGSFDLFTEDATWNRCIRLTAGPVQKHKISGNKMSGADVIVSGADGKGIPVEPEQFYDYSFELKGSPKRAVSRFLERGLRFEPGKDWRSFKGRFRTGKKAERIELQFVLWTYVDKPESFGNNLFKPGDNLLIDNLSLVRDEQFPKIKAMLEKSREPFRVAPYAVEAEASCPFLPPELAKPPKKIVIRAAVNEKKPLPVAIANLTDTFAQYRVVLEANPGDIDAGKPIRDTGIFGLKGYPKERSPCARHCVSRIPNLIP